MRKEITYIAPLRAGIVSGILYFIVSLLFVPLFLLIGFGSRGVGMGEFSVFSTGFAIALPFAYGAIAFVAGVIGAALYNFVARWVGGFEVEVADIEYVG